MTDNYLDWKYMLNRCPKSGSFLIPVGLQNQNFEWKLKPNLLNLAFRVDHLALNPFCATNWSTNLDNRIVAPSCLHKWVHVLPSTYDDLSLHGNKSKSHFSFKVYFSCQLFQIQLTLEQCLGNGSRTCPIYSNPQMLKSHGCPSVCTVLCWWIQPTVTCIVL